MRKTIRRTAIFAGAAAFCALPSLAFALAGVCSNCHTMHNSEQGNAVAYVSDGAGGVTLSVTPLPVLLKGDCYGCHANGGTSRNTGLSGASMPQVFHTDSTDLSGGNFAYITGLKGGVSNASSRKGHNVVSLVGEDDILTGPPGYARGPLDAQTINTSVHTFAMATAFSCAGKAGCHGQRNSLAVAEELYANGMSYGTHNVYKQDLGAMKGTHHQNATGALSVADTLGNSFRFLQGVRGYENATYEQTVGDHNEYYGDPAGTSTNWAQGLSCERCHVDGHGAAVSDTETIKAPNNDIASFCETCHSQFHSTFKQDGGSSFIRHPTDYTLPTTGEYSNYTAYDVTAPIARSSVVSASSSTVTPGSDVVMCLSCHVAHASANDGMLRFNYSDMVLGSANGTGCFVCHNTKD